MGLVIIDITMACFTVLVCFFFSTKTMGMIKSKFGIIWENTAPGTEILLHFCGRTGPLQLDIVLVILLGRSLMILYFTIRK